MSWFCLSEKSPSVFKAACMAASSPESESLISFTPQKGITMTDKELYKQKFQAQLDEWTAEIDKMKAKALEAKIDAKLEMNKLVAELEAKAQVATAKLTELSEASEEAWDSTKTGAEAVWESVKSSFNEVVAKFKS
jgi:hypothetical protein